MEPSFKLEVGDELNNNGRLGTLEHPNKPPLSTPHYFSISSRGCVPHLTPDMIRDETSIKALYTAFEDSLQRDTLLILGPRRIPPLLNATPNTYTSITICTSTGFRKLELLDYIDAATRLRPDVVIAPVDVEIRAKEPGLKRQETMVERSTAWVRGMVEGFSSPGQLESQRTAIWVPILPLEYEMQKSYLKSLQDYGTSSFGGVVLYHNDQILNIPSNLQHLPRISLADPSTPHQILSSISAGIDLFALPLVTTQSEAGIAFAFKFTVREATDERLPLGLDLASSMHATDLSPLVKDCVCYTCRNHHRAYVRHLLSTGEMLAWVLLQIHNHHFIDLFFEGIRNSMVSGGFADSVRKFALAYEDDFPTSISKGPRMRGYQLPPGPAAQKLNKAPFRKLEEATNANNSRGSKGGVSSLNDQENRKAESKEVSLIGPETNALDLEDLGFGNLYVEEQGFTTASS